MKTLITCMLLLSITPIHQLNNRKEITNNAMKVRWKIEQGFIYFELEAPTNGWIAIGFNESASLAGTYLLMGRIRNGKAEVVEHYTDKPGSYKPIVDYGVTSQTLSISGDEKADITRLKFAIPTAKSSKYHKQLSPDTKWSLLMAYSVDDDFQHHSIMRTSTEIKL